MLLICRYSTIIQNILNGLTSLHKAQNLPAVYRLHYSNLPRLESDAMYLFIVRTTVSSTRAQRMTNSCLRFQEIIITDPTAYVISNLVFFALYLLSVAQHKAKQFKKINANLPALKISILVFNQVRTPAAGDGGKIQKLGLLLIRERNRLGRLWYANLSRGIVSLENQHSRFFF